jgi:hypothetical protein
MLKAMVSPGLQLVMAQYKVPGAPTLLTPSSLTVTVTVAAFAATTSDRRTEAERIGQVKFFIRINSLIVFLTAWV